MLSILLCLTGAACVGAWLYLLLANGRFWRTRELLLSMPEQARVANMEALRVAVVIPARNEQARIGQTAASLLAQRFPGELHIFVVDDNSTDATAEAARAAARNLGGNSVDADTQVIGNKRSLTVLAGRPLAAGWVGKVWALQQGVDRALAPRPDFLLLTDADIEHAPDSVAALVAKAQGEPGYDLVSLLVRLRCCSLVERLLMPAFAFFFLMLYPPIWTADARRHTAGAAGGCILVRPEALARAGGLAAIRGEIIDDCALARNLKRSGARLWLGLADRTHSLSGYDSFAEVGRMIARTAFNQLGHSLLMLLGAVGGLFFVYLLPVLLLFTSGAASRAVGAAALALISLCYLPTVRYYRLSPPWALTLPAAALFYLAATVASAWQYWSGRGGQWKGRFQDVAP